MNKEQLTEEVAVRVANRGLIQERINEYCFNRYGIQDFFAVAQQFLYSAAKKNEINICLGRQVSCPNIEHLAVNQLARVLTSSGLPANSIAMSFVRDSFASANEYKQSLVKLPYIFRSRKGKLVVENESIVSLEHKPDLEGRTLDRIDAHSGQTLADFHFQKRSEVLGDHNLVVDMSGFVKELARQAVVNGGASQPEFLFVRNGSKEKKLASAVADFSNGHDPRPPADWYYLPYLMLFVDGTCALASTVDEDPRVIAWFSGNIALIERICGFKPLIIDTPLKVTVEDFTSKLNEIPRWVSQHEGWRDIINPSLDLADARLFHIVEHLETQLIANC